MARVRRRLSNRLLALLLMFVFRCRLMRGSDSKRRPQRMSETLRIIDSAQERMTKANQERSAISSGK